jgi:hypothetical protein
MVCTSIEVFVLNKTFFRTDIVRIALYNLILREKAKGSRKVFFQYKDELCSFIDKNWDSLCFGKTRTKTWENTIGSALSTKPHYFESGAETLGQAGYWTLRNPTDPSLFKESGAKSTSKKDKKKKGLKVAKKKRSLVEIYGADDPPAVINSIHW